MKGVMLSILGASGALLLYGGVRTELTTLRQSDASKRTQLSEVKTLLGSLDEGAQGNLARRLEDGVARLAVVEKRLADTRFKVAALESKLDESTRQATRTATEAIGNTQALTRTVESAQKLAKQREARFASLANHIDERIREQRDHVRDLQHRVRPDPYTMTTDMLAPTVQLSGDETVGSGTLFASVPARNGKGFETYVLTANHVVRNILSDDPELAQRGITVTLYTERGTKEYKCDVVLRNPNHDLALAKVRSRRRFAPVAKLIPAERVSKMPLWTPVYAVGCPLGNDPVPTGGFISSLANVVRGTKYWMINAPTYYGNSGGGIFNGETHELIAVFSKIYTHGSTRPIVIPHMGLAVPMTLVYPWLDENKYGYLAPNAEMATPGK
jgi:S1-C subfamily serine protease